MKTTEQTALLDELRSVTTTDQRAKQIMAELKAIDAKQTEQRKREKLNQVNTDHAKKREILTALLSVPMPDEDIRVNDGSFHATKIKRYPELKALVDGQYLRFEFAANCYHTAKNSRERFSILEPTYEYGKPDSYKPFESFEAACDYNGILPQEMTFAEFQRIESAVLAESERIKAEISKSQQKMRDLGAFTLSSNNLVRTSQMHVTEYFTI